MNVMIATNILRQFMRSTRAELLTQYEKSKGLEHNVLRGTARENFIQLFLERSFPKKFVLGSGEVFDAKGAVSKQADIVVYDEMLPILHHSPGVGQFLAEGVLAHIEVKTSLDKKTLEDALAMVGSVKGLAFEVNVIMQVGDMRREIPSFVVAYSGPTPATFKANFEAFYSMAENVNLKKPSGVFVLEQGYAAILKGDSGVIEFATWGEDILSVSFTHLYEAFWKNWTAFPSLHNYVAGVTGRTF